MTAATMFFLFAMVTGHGDAASLMTLGEFKDQASCATAQAAAKAALSTATEPSHLFCVRSDELSGLAKAAHSN